MLSRNPPAGRNQRWAGKTQTHVLLITDSGVKQISGASTFFGNLLKTYWNISHPFSFITPANEVWGKVMFLHLSVILFTRAKGVYPQPAGCRPPWMQTPRDVDPLWMQTP